MTAMVAASYFDTRSSRAHAVTLDVMGGDAILRDERGHEMRRAPLASLRVSERTRRAPRLVTFSDGAYCEITDHAAFDALLAATGHREGWVSRAQNSWRLVGIAAAGLVAACAVCYYVVLPWGARILADAVPASVEAQLGQATLDALDARMVEATKLSEADQRRIRDNFAALKLPADPGHRYDIQFRKGARIGPNALALPGGTIVVTDELVALAGTGAGMMGVLAHEAGHVAQRHGLQQVIQASAIGAAAVYVFGDFSTILAGVPAAMLTMRYSREHEREADAFAIDVLRANRLPVTALADVLQQLEDAHARRSGKAKQAENGVETGAEKKNDEGSDFFASHPLTSERIEAIREAAR
ncbi:peptidase M48-like protein [Cupriavidus plantarum]|nr:peptidase M48-like protein [Cupriavidus plantarum]